MLFTRLPIKKSYTVEMNGSSKKSYEMRSAAVAVVLVDVERVGTGEERNEKVNTL